MQDISRQHTAAFTGIHLCVAGASTNKLCLLETGEQETASVGKGCSSTQQLGLQLLYYSSSARGGCQEHTSGLSL